ncbi:excinuclease ABC subunit A [Candidatus Falkowbacteria bacterium RIFOXYA2_FULL_47_9]|uniref:UvrABC system protein A n=1 Tax=Candidatus Falkowbacteria bacterium RIFOXYA2_FULL_47_9 TaxID=1797995 RepID=A0A1F5SQ81_9BACT|nr:MAG: excinuclease ABC subunit A [Candidatus Falkowbacteria bacterium RIFOXYA2_FULL_47_9]
MSQKFIVIRGARTHNLKNIDVDIPRHKLVVMTGLSGSGKSSLAFDTIYAEGQRRYLESLSSYAKQYVDLMDKPDVDSITGLTPTIAIDQKANTATPRSTVGTATEIYDLLRLLYARGGVPHCPQTGEPLTKKSVADIVAQIAALPQPVTILAPIVRNAEITDKKIISKIAKAGFAHIILDGQFYSSQTYALTIPDGLHSLSIVIAQTDVSPKKTIPSVRDKNEKFELQKHVKKALDLSNGFVSVFTLANGKKTEVICSTIWSCAASGFSLPDLEPKHFSFNSPFGACPACHGLGTKLSVVAALLLNDKLSINEGAIRAWPKNNGAYRKHLDELAALAHKHKFSLNTPVQNLSANQRDLILNGNGSFVGIAALLEERYQESDSLAIKSDLEQYMRVNKCPACNGERLKPEYRAVTVAGVKLAGITALTVAEAKTRLSEILKRLTNGDKKIAEPIIKEISVRLEALAQSGLSYVTIDRTVASLSGGEAQRVKLATQLASNLVNVTYILDEPSVGLHPRDIAKLIATLKKLRDLENTVIVVEHDETLMQAADYIIDVGPGAGAFGGLITAKGTPAEVAANPHSLTGQYLAHKKTIPQANGQRQGSGQILTIVGASEHNLQNITVEFPLGTFIALTGVSGSGKSTLMTDILSKALAKKFYRAKEEPGAHKEIRGLEHIDKVITIDQSPIGRTPRSNPATYTGCFTYIRELFSELPEAKIKNFNPSHFSFNIVGGRCEVCSGDGFERIDMQFLSDVYVKCKVCDGTRYQKEILDVCYKEKNIAGVLDMAVVEAKEFFRGEETILQKLNILDEVGLGYIKLGQSATTLSGGEAQRVKLATELSRRDTGRTLYILDEPTTGLHFDDIKRLLSILQKLVDKGNTVLIIEHNLDVIKSVDWVIDLGPEGGDKGGRVVACGTPSEVAKVKESYTGQYLKKILK